MKEVVHRQVLLEPASGISAQIGINPEKLGFIDADGTISALLQMYLTRISVLSICKCRVSEMP